MRTRATPVARRDLGPAASPERRLVLIQGGAGDEVDEPGERWWAGRYVLRPRDGGFAARWAAALAGSGWPLREHDRRALPRRRASRRTV
jgi:hypothetical protein